MADTVRFFMEEMVPELEDLQEKGYFSKPEIREIVRRRENFEYALKRRTALKADFLRYIEYETNLAELLRLRKAALGIPAGKGKGDTGITKRCHLLYERATRKFRGDLRLWLSWLTFCKDSDSTRQLSRALTKALQLHPTAAGLWSYAAAWEFQHNRNTSAARSLMQRGLRVCKADQQLWLEYFCMELTYAQKLRTRQKILGIEPKGTTHGGSDAEDLIEPAEAEGSALEAVLSGAVAKLVCQEAIKNVPDSLAFRQRLLEALEGFSFAGVQAIAQDIYAGIEADFGDSEDAWDLRARRCTGALASTSEADPREAGAAVFEAATAALPTSRMYDLYAAFLLEQVGQEGHGEGEDSNALKGQQKKAAKRVLTLYQRAADAGALSEGAALSWPRLALQCRQVKQALSAADRATAVHPAAAAVWSQCITLHSQQAILQGEGGRDAEAKIGGLVLEAVSAVAKEDAAGLWILGLQTYRSLGIPRQGLLDQLQLFLALSRKGPLRGGNGAAAAEAVQLVKEEEGIEAARSLYRALLKLPPTGGSLYHCILDLELDESSKRPLPFAKLKPVFEAAVDAYGSEDTELWLRYARFEEAQGHGTGDIHWRATKALDNPDAFVAQLSGSI